MKREFAGAGLSAGSNRGAGREMADIAALNQDKHYYASTPELLQTYAEMVPPVDAQK